MGLQETIDQLKSDIEKIGVDGVLAFALPQAPWLSYPIINYMARFIIGKIVGILVDKTELGAFIVYTVHQKDKQAKEYAEAAQALENAKEISDEEKERLKKAKIDAARKLIKFTPVL